MKTVADEQKQTYVSPLLRLQVGLSFFAFILIGAHDGAVGVLIPSLQRYYGVDKATISLLFLCATVGYLIAAFNSGLLVEKLGPRFFLLLGTSSFLLGTIVLSFIPPFAFVLLMLLAIGFGMAIIDAGLNAYIAGLPRNAALLNYLHAFYGAGALLGPVIASSLLVSGLQWNSVYWVEVGLGFLVLIGFGVFFRSQVTSVQKEVVPVGGNVLFSALKLRVVWIVALFLLFYVGAEVSMGSWSYTFLTEARHEAPFLSGWVVSGYWFGLTIGRLILAPVASRVGSKRLIQGCLVGVVAGIVLIWFAPVFPVTAFGLWLTGFSLGPIFPSAIALMSNLVSSRILPSAIGFLASLGSVGGALFPWLAGNLVQRVGLNALLPFIVALAVVMLFLWFALQRQQEVPRFNPNE